MKDLQDYVKLLTDSQTNTLEELTKNTVTLDALRQVVVNTLQQHPQYLQPLLADSDPEVHRVVRLGICCAVIFQIKDAQLIRRDIYRNALFHIQEYHLTFHNDLLKLLCSEKYRDFLSYALLNSFINDIQITPDKFKPWPQDDFNFLWNSLGKLKLKNLTLHLVDFNQMTLEQIQLICNVLKQCNWEKLTLTSGCVSEMAPKRLQMLLDAMSESNLSTLFIDTIAPGYKYQPQISRAFLNFLKKINSKLKELGTDLSFIRLLPDNEWNEFCQSLANTTLKILNLAHTHLIGLSVPRWQELCAAIAASSINELDFYANYMNELSLAQFDPVAQLIKNPKIHGLLLFRNYLALNNNKLFNHVIDAVFHSKLSKLNLAENRLSKLDDVDFQLLFSAIAQSDVTDFSFERNFEGAPSENQLAILVKELPRSKIKFLNWSNNNLRVLSETALSQFCDAIGKLDLQSLTLNSCDIGSMSCEKITILSTLFSKPNLQQLALSENYFSHPFHLRVLCHAFATSNLSTIDLTRCSLQDSYDGFTQATQSNISLVNFFLDLGQLTLELYQALAVNTQLAQFCNRLKTFKNTNQALAHQAVNDLVQQYTVQLEKWKTAPKARALLQTGLAQFLVYALSVTNQRFDTLLFSLNIDHSNVTDLHFAYLQMNYNLRHLEGDSKQEAFMQCIPYFFKANTTIIAFNPTQQALIDRLLLSILSPEPELDRIPSISIENRILLLHTLLCTQLSIEIPKISLEHLTSKQLSLLNDHQTALEMPQPNLANNELQNINLLKKLLAHWLNIYNEKEALHEKWSSFTRALTVSSSSSSLKRVCSREFDHFDDFAEPTFNPD